MNHYGLRFTADDGRSLQVRIGGWAKRDVCARSCPNGEWSAWRWLDVERGSDGILNETCLTANNAKLADAVSRLAYPITIILNGDVDGSCRFDGASSVVIQTSATAITMPLGILETRQPSLESQLAAIAVEHSENTTKIANCERDLASLTGKVNSAAQGSQNLEGQVGDFSGRISNLESRAAKLESGHTGSRIARLQCEASPWDAFFNNA